MRIVRCILSLTLTLVFVLGGFSIAMGRACGEEFALTGAYADTPPLFKQGEEFLYDLDGDGTVETLRLESSHDDERDEDYTRLVATGEKVDAEFVIDALFQSSALLCDIDPNDDAIDILISGDVMSDDYYTWRLTFKDGAFVMVEREIPGLAEDFSHGKVVMGDWIDILGTRWCKTSFAPDANGKLTKDKDALWQVEKSYDDWSWMAMETKAPLPVALLNGAVQTDGFLPAGVRLLITATDGVSAAYFATEDGREGRIDVSPSARGWGFDINGVPEDDYFVTVPYAG